jgi:hypothetical protein
VAPEAFGGGNKLIHNVVGGIGVVQGNGGRLRPGLPWQAVHDGDEADARAAAAVGDDRGAALKTTRGANFRFYPGDYNLMILVWFKDLKLALARAV